MTTPTTKSTPRILDLAIVLAVLVMFLGLIGGVGALGRRDFTGAGLCLLASGLTAGLLANAVLRD